MARRAAEASVSAGTDARTTSDAEDGPRSQYRQIGEENIGAREINGAAVGGDTDDFGHRSEVPAGFHEPPDRILTRPQRLGRARGQHGDLPAAIRLEERAAADERRADGVEIVRRDVAVVGQRTSGYRTLVVDIREKVDRRFTAQRQSARQRDSVHAGQRSESQPRVVEEAELLLGAGKGRRRQRDVDGENLRRVESFVDAHQPDEAEHEQARRNEQRGAERGLCGHEHAPRAASARPIAHGVAVGFERISRVRGSAS